MLVVLGLIDVVMIANLLIMVIVGGYETFVSRLTSKATRTSRNGCPTSMPACSRSSWPRRSSASRSIHLLKTFINAENLYRAHDHVAGHHPRRLPDSPPSAMAHCRQDHDPDPRPVNTKSTPTKQRSSCMTTIRQEDLIQSVADAFQYISYYHPLDYIQALGEAYEREQSPAAKDAIAQILTNSRMCCRRPPPDLPGHRHRHGLPQGRHERAAGDATHEHPGDDRRRRAPRLQRPGQPAARLGAGRPGRHAQEHQGQHAGRRAYRNRSRRPRRSDLRGQGRRLGETSPSSPCSTRPTTSSTGC